MRWNQRFLLCLIVSIGLFFGFVSRVYADSIGDTGGTGEGGITGSNVYTFSYIYDASNDAIELKVDTKNPIKGFGNTTSHTFTSPSDKTVLNTKNPRLGNSLDNAVASMNAVGGYNLSVSYVKSALNSLGYYDAGNGIWKYSGGYLTYVSAVKVRPKNHTVTYDANGGTGAPGNQTKTQGTNLTLSSTKPTKTGYTFQNWTASIGGTYNPSGTYIHDQDGGTVTMKANWKDETAPSCSEFSAVPNSWSAGNGTITFKVRDQGSGLASVIIERYSYVTRTWSTFKTLSYNGTTAELSGSYSETSEGVFYYKLTVKDKAGNLTSKTTNAIYLDHSNPVIYGLENTVKDWTNIAPVIQISTTDYLYGTTYNGSGVVSVVINDDAGNIVARGTTTVSYTLQPKYEGIHTWYVTIKDAVGHIRTGTVTTKYDITKPGIDGTETTFVTRDGVTVSGYCQDNIVSQHIDDGARRSVNNPNCTSGLSSVIVYKVKNNQKTAIYSSSTQKSWSNPNTNSSFDVYYDINNTDDVVDYYLVIAKDFAGNMTTKKLTSQRALLMLFHTSIDRSSYE